jgi:sialic acid synthase SpsE
VKIGTHDIDEKILIVAEIGNNHEGNFDTARRMVEAAADAGVDAVKFQTFKTQLFTSNADPARVERLKRFELTHAQFTELRDLAKSRGLIWFSTPLDLESARFLEPLVDVFKIASGDNDFLALIAQVAATNKPLIISTGLADLEHLEWISSYARERGAEGQLAFLHCVCAYPAPAAEVNLRAIPLLAAELGVPIGWSDHTLGPRASLAAAAIGARIIEKHFTLNRAMKGTDHKFSLEPIGMKKMIRDLLRVRLALGDGRKKVYASEASPALKMGKKLVAVRDLPAGHVLTAADIAIKSPGDGLAPYYLDRVLGQVLTQEIRVDQAITMDAIGQPAGVGASAVRSAARV